MSSSSDAAAGARPVVVSAVLGAVLVGGGSSRMGADKATLVVDGLPMAARAVAALHTAGISDVVLIGASGAHVDLPGRPVADAWPGEGPVGGVLTALREAASIGATGVVCLAADLPAVDADAVELLLGDGGPAIRLGAVGGRVVPPNGWWPVEVRSAIEARFAEGARSFRNALPDGADGLQVIAVDVPALADADEPADLDGHAVAFPWEGD